jgi:periplasmic divalent cation tolerance protein
MTDARVVLTTCGNREEAEKMATALVEARVAACVNIVGPIRSVYRWEGKVENADEFLLLVKTWGEAYDDVERMIGELHSYDLPECVALRVERGSEAYLEWVANSVGELD